MLGSRGARFDMVTAWERLMLDRARALHVVAQVTATAERWQDLAASTGPDRRGGALMRPAFENPDSREAARLIGAA